MAHKADGPVPGFARGMSVPRDDIPGMDCEILVLAAQPDVLTIANAGKVSARVILEGANILLLYARRQNAGRFGDWLLVAPPLVIDEPACDEIIDRLEITLAAATDEVLSSAANTPAAGHAVISRR